MKKKLFKIGAALAGLLLLLCLVSQPLAQPEVQAPQADKFVGFHVVQERMPPSEEERMAHPDRYPPEDRSHWVEYGDGEEVQVEGLGKFTIPREILIGQYDPETGEYTFPGLEGYNCFLAEEKMEDGGTRYTGNNGLSDVHITSGGEKEGLSGTIYMGLPLGQTEWDTSEDIPDDVWTTYRVYQMEDGTVYLDGSGNSYSGPGGLTYSEKSEWTHTVDGETTTQTFEVEVKMEEVPRLERLVVTQFGPEHVVLRETAFTPEELEEAVELTLERDTLWLLIEERAVDGSVTRTAYDEAEVKEDGLSHFLVLLDREGQGYTTGLNLSRA